MHKILVFGTGQYAEKYLALLKPRIRELYGDFEIVGFLDNNKQKHGEIFCDKKIYSPSEGLKLDFDDIAVLSNRYNYQQIQYQLCEIFSVPVAKTHYYTWYLKECYIKRYADSKDIEVQNLIDYWRNHDISMYNLYRVKADQHKWYEVFDDEETGLSYVWLETAAGFKRKLYYPGDWGFFVLDGYNRCMIDVLGEQNDNSPHKYTKAGHEVNEGDIVADVGACEGNFALYWAELADKLYLFEPDIHWQKALYYTFLPYENKTTLFMKAVSDKSNENNVTLNEAIPETVDFLKMDVEGDELSALRGGGGISVAA